MEKDETVSDSSPHIANIGRLVEVRAGKPPQLEPAAGSLACIWSHVEEFSRTLAFVFPNQLLTHIVSSLIVLMLSLSV